MRFNLSGDPWDFQLKAISSIVNDFKSNNYGRYLLVLPTGGGKTLTAIRIINEMVNNKSINTTDKVLWVVHT
nr:DEAD/DEAH box helicase family protein [Candidatus Paceibacterota bacterium]